MISVVIPSYNSARYLPAAIASVRGQTHPVDQIIIVDDGSTDDTATIVSNLGRDIIYLRQANAGPAAARNLGISRAKGDYLCFLDADDQWTKDKISTQLAALKSHPELALVAADMSEIDVHNKITTHSMLAKHKLLDFFVTLNGRPIPNALAHLATKNFIPTGTVMARRAILEKAGGFNPQIRYGEDLEFWARIAARHPIACLPNVHLLRLQHETNSTKSMEPMLADLVVVMKEICNWGSEELRKQGVNPHRLVANAYADLGYWYFVNEDISAARRAFMKSLHNSPNHRGFVYAMACLLPTSLITRLRHIKQSYNT